MGDGSQSSLAFVSFTQHMHIWKAEISAEALLPSDWPLGHFLDC